MPQVSNNEHGINNKTYKKEFASRTKKKAVMTPMPRVTRPTIAGQAANRVAWQSQ
jgi:hypothetical protein